MRLYRFVTDTLSAVCELLPDAELTAEEFVSALNLIFTSSGLGSVPNVQDCVIIGSASTLRVENIRASLLLGLCEGEFPRAVSDDGLLTDSDKLALEEFEIHFDSDLQMRSSEELLYVYRAMTKPTEKLFLSTVSMQPDGSARTPSLAFTRVCFLLDRKPQAFDSNAVKALFNAKNAVLTSPTFPSEAHLNVSTLRLSQSKIQSFVLCPYRYYSTYQLQLRAKKDSRPSYSDDGIFLHYVFERFMNRCLDENGKLIPPPKDQLEAVANEIVNTYLSEMCPLPPEHMDRRLMHLFVRLRKLSVIMLREMLAELEHGMFVPSKFEQVIGMPGENGLPAIAISLKNGTRVLLSGKVDRIDMYEKDGKTYVRVVDYKSGTHKFQLEDVQSGLDIQLVLYLFAVLSSDPQRYKPFGAQYLYATTEKGKIGIARSGFQLDNDEIGHAADDTPERTYSKSLLAQTEDEIRELTAEMNRAVASVAERILACEIQKTPSEQACMFCPVRAHCDKAYHK